MQPFEGKKWFCPNEYTEVVDCFGYVTKKPVFRMTSAYRAYLAEKEAAKQAHELRVLKSKLDYQFETYGEVDEVDYNQYVRLLGQQQISESSKSKFTGELVILKQ